MTQGLEAGVSEVNLGPDGAIYVGGLGAGGNWGQTGKLQYGLQKLTPNGSNAFDILAMRAQPERVRDRVHPAAVGGDRRRAGHASTGCKQWRYVPTAAYGGPKIDEQTLSVSSATLSADGKKVTLVINGLQAGRVVYVRSPRPFTLDQRPVAVEHRGLVHAQRHPRQAPADQPGPGQAGHRRLLLQRQRGPGQGGQRQRRRRQPRQVVLARAPPSGCRSTSAPARPSTGSSSSTPAPAVRTRPGTPATSTSRSAPTAPPGRRWPRSPPTPRARPRTTSRPTRPATSG